MENRHNKTDVIHNVCDVVHMYRMKHVEITGLGDGVQ